MQRYAELEEKLVELRNLSKVEVTSFLDDEIGSRLDKLSRQVARIDKRLYTHHEVFFPWNACQELNITFRDIQRSAKEKTKLENCVP